MIDSELVSGLWRAAIVVVTGIVLARLAGAGLGRLLGPHFSAQSVMVARRLTTWTLYLVVLLAALHQLGVNPGVLLGAAGVLTVAIGFASQTSASNVISGLFLIAERPFVVGDVVEVDAVKGEVISIDLMSVKLRTFDNLFVRLPNETMVKSKMINLTHFPIRRFDHPIAVDYRADLDEVRRVLAGVADANPLCLDEPKPLFVFQGFEESAMRIQFSVWTATPNFIELRNRISGDVKAAFDAAGLPVPFPRRVLELDGPLDVRVVGP